jgi:hypothetical protein
VKSSFFSKVKDFFSFLDRQQDEVASTTIEVTCTNIEEICFQHLATHRSFDICFARCADDLELKHRMMINI